jgi:hypothetical protein
MVGLAALGTFPASTCAFVGVTYQLLGLDLIGPVGVLVIAAALLTTIGAIVVVWRHPEGIAHKDRFD